MNKLIALTTLVVLINSVQYGSSERLCAITKGHPEKSIMFGDCFTSNFPALVIDTFTSCYEKAFGGPGNIAMFVDKLCEDFIDLEGMQAMDECLEVEDGKTPDFTKEEQRNARYGTESCFIEKLGVTKEEYDTILANYRREDVESEENEVEE